MQGTGAPRAHEKTPATVSGFVGNMVRCVARALKATTPRSPLSSYSCFTCAPRAGPPSAAARLQEPGCSGRTCRDSPAGRRRGPLTNLTQV